MTIKESPGERFIHTHLKPDRTKTGKFNVGIIPYLAPEKDQMASRSLPSFILTFLNRILKKHCVQFTPTPLFLSTVRNLLFTKSLSPKFCSICLGDPERVSLEEATGENPFEFCQHVAEYQGQFGQVPPAKDHRNCFF